MSTVARPKKTAPRERCSSPAELADERARWIRATTKPPAPESQGNLCATLAVFAAWKPCSSCHCLTLYVDSTVRTDSDFVCGTCKARQDLLTREVARALRSLAMTEART
jgi:hypothetical protein